MIELITKLLLFIFLKTEMYQPNYVKLRERVDLLK